MQPFSDIETLNELQFNNLFNSSLINNLPYLFWMYEWIDNDFKLIKWNKNQEIFTEYHAKELFHMPFSHFFKKEDKEIIDKAVAAIFVKGKVKFFKRLLTKTGKHIPYYFEGYQFIFTDRQIFIGIGVDVSEHIKTKEKLRGSELEKQRLQMNIAKYEEEILTLTTQILQNNKINNRIDRHIGKALNTSDIVEMRAEMIKMRKIINAQQVSQNNWELFQDKFDNVQQGFINQLRVKHPDLTKAEVKFCSYIKMRIPIPEIASILNISSEGIKKKKYRIRKKFNLQRHDALDHYISNL